MKRNVYEIIKTAKEEKDETILNYNETILALSEKKEKIKNDPAAALKDNNADKYIQAKEGQKDIEYTIEFCKLKLAEEESTGIIKDPEEIKKLARELRAEVKEINAEKMKRAGELLREAEKIVKEARQEVVKCNNALTDLTNKTNVAPGHIEVITLSILVNVINNALNNGLIKSNK